MSEAQNPGPGQPRIRDPHAPVNLVGGAAQAAPDSPLVFPVADDGEVEELNLAAVADPAPAAPAAADGDIVDLTGDRALVAVDPLTRRPRTSSRVLCAVLAAVCFAAAAGIWWLGVRTEDGQSFDDLAESTFVQHAPGWLTAVVRPFTATLRLPLLPAGSSYLVFGISALLAVAAVAVAAVRRRWWLLGQLVAFGAVCYALTWLKELLPRPFIIHTVAGTAQNSAPSGHTMLAAASALMLAMAVPRAWRALAAILAAVWSAIVALSVVAGSWHRPTDAAMGLLLVGGTAMLTLAFSRTSGMDEPGRRMSSASVQIVGSVMVTGGVMAVLYGAYVVWQVVPGLSMSAEWAQSGAVGASCVLLAGLAVLLAGLTLAMRQLTAAPLTKLGLVGAPPAPPVGAPGK
ncbi:phosphatase PAP2 family protein [Bifidobacterium pullorum subsp. saeculare]|uniref:Phosphatase PAP2 family protein n=1 Tax=Bifidobacterium pullorum subsp. saeculare TaxID=78257 RepID=A0A939BAA9_9BIFI|nr:phosphatase PAP2 family protein [Bifidobacterium pullorum]MBM6700130.1 phosphatase PAP2 family protein [Bifidobacterium pullorum subsp. saeculare]